VFGLGLVVAEAIQIGGGVGSRTLGPIQILGHDRGSPLEQGPMVLELFPEPAFGNGYPAVLTRQVQEARKGAGQCQ
jgi:hypothetical protein